MMEVAQNMIQKMKYLAASSMALRSTKDILIFVIITSEFKQNRTLNRTFASSWAYFFAKVHKL